MAFTFDNLKSAIANGGNQWLINRIDAGTTGGFSASVYYWRDRFFVSPVNGSIDGRNPSTPTSAVTCSSSTSGSIPLRNSSSRNTLIGFNGDWKATQSTGASNWTSYQDIMPFVLCDRLSHQGGLDGNVSGTQSVNLPTAALTRYTDGIGVFIGLSVYTGVGSTATTITATYTNSDSVSGRITSAISFSNINAGTTGQLVFLPLQAGDKGAKSVESVTLAASTGTSGNFGVVLYKPIGVWLASNTGNSTSCMPTGTMMGGLPQIQDNACLFFLSLTNTLVATCNILVTEV